MDPPLAVAAAAVSSDASAADALADAVAAVAVAAVAAVVVVVVQVAVSDLISVVLVAVRCCSQMCFLQTQTLRPLITVQVLHTQKSANPETTDDRSPANDPIRTATFS